MRKGVGTAAASTATMQATLEMGAGIVAESAAKKILGGRAQIVADSGRSGAHKTRSIMDLGDTNGTATPAVGNAAAPELIADESTITMTADPPAGRRSPMKPAACTAITVILPAARIAVKALIAVGLAGPGERPTKRKDVPAAVLRLQRLIRQGQQQKQVQRTHPWQRRHLRQKTQHIMRGEKGGFGILAKTSKDGST
jgi:hypothetical protein